MITVEDVSKSFDQRKVLSNVSLTIPRSSVCGVMGKNGAGKTTLINMILGRTDYAGSIHYDTLLRHKEKSLDKNAVYVVEDNPFLYGYLSGIEHIEFLLKIKNKTITERNRILEVLHIFGIDEMDAFKLTKDYSFGMRRKIVLVAGFLAKPKFMIFDEPTLGLDAPSLVLLKSLIRGAAKKGTAIVVTSHDPSLVSEICDSLIVLHKTKAHDLTSSLRDGGVALSQSYMRIIETDVDHNVSTVLNNM